MKIAICSKNINENLEYIQFLLDDGYSYRYINAIDTYIEVFGRLNGDLHIIIFDDNEFMYEYKVVNYDYEKIFIKDFIRKNKLKKLL